MTALATAPMTTFCIQVQPDRAPELDMERVLSLCRLATSRRVLVERHSIVEGVDDAGKGPHVNLVFDTAEPRALWDLLRSLFYEDSMVGPALATASLVMCEGEDGWDDYRVLHHFDPQVEIDEI